MGRIPIQRFISYLQKKSQLTFFFIENSCSIIYNKTTAVIHKMNECMISKPINWLIRETQKVPTIMQSPESKYESLWKWMITNYYTCPSILILNHLSMIVYIFWLCKLKENLVITH